MSLEDIITGRVLVLGEYTSNVVFNSKFGGCMLDGGVDSVFGN